MTADRPEEPREDEPPLAPHLRRSDGSPPAEHARSQTRLAMLTMFVAVPLLLVFAIVLGSLASGPPSTAPDGDGGASSGLAQVNRYCNYLAQTDAAFEPCLDANRDRAFLSKDTNAARYARGDLDECLADAGPRCTVR